MRWTSMIWTVLLCSVLVGEILHGSGPVEAGPRSMESSRERGPAISGMMVANLDDAERAVVLTDMYDQAGGPYVHLDRPGLGPGGRANIYLPAEGTVKPQRRYSAIMWSDRAIATQVRTEWPYGSDTAVYGNPLPGRRQVLPVMAGFDPRPATERSEPGLRLHSVVHVQNADVEAEARVEWRLRDAAAGQIDAGVLTIDPGRSISLDEAPDSPLASVPPDSIASLELVSEAPLAVASFLGLEPAPTAAMAFEALPADLAEPRLHAPLVSSGAWTSRIVLVNPGSGPATVRLRYQGNADATGDACPAGPIEEALAGPILPGRTHWIDHAPGGGSRLPEGCWASALVDSDQPLLGFVMLLHEEHRAAAAYRLRRGSEAGRRSAPLFLLQRYLPSELSTAFQVYNPGEEAVDVRLGILDPDGQPVDCPGCRGVVPARGSRMWHPDQVVGLEHRVGFWATAWVEASGPVLATAFEHSLPGTQDALIWASQSRDEPAGGWPARPLPNYLPVVDYNFRGLLGPWFARHFLPVAWR